MWELWLAPPISYMVILCVLTLRAKNRHFLLRNASEGNLCLEDNQQGGKGFCWMVAFLFLDAVLRMSKSQGTACEVNLISWLWEDVLHRTLESITCGFCLLSKDTDQVCCKVHAITQEGQEGLKFFSTIWPHAIFFLISQSAISASCSSLVYSGDNESQFHFLLSRWKDPQLD